MTLNDQAGGYPDCGAADLDDQPVLAQAHSLGIDPAILRERTPGQYMLNARVPPRLQSRIAAPILPERCRFAVGPVGTASEAGIVYEFSCAPALTSHDVIQLPWSREGVLLTVERGDGSGATRLVAGDGGKMDIALGDFLASSAGFPDAARRYTLLGVFHILEGFDHLAFVLALMIVVGGGWRLIRTITAFTLAHSLTLGFAILGYLSVPPAPVEAAIALSIVFVCAEIIHASQGRRGLTYAYPWIVSFTFGLLHGFGFAGALSDIGLPASDVPVALLFFNIGVELGQLLFVAVVFAILAVLTRLKLEIPQALRLVPVYIIGAVSAFWFLQRVGSIFY